MTIKAMAEIQNIQLTSGIYGEIIKVSMLLSDGCEIYMEIEDVELNGERYGIIFPDKLNVGDIITSIKYSIDRTEYKQHVILKMNIINNLYEFDTIKIQMYNYHRDYDFHNMAVFVGKTLNWDCIDIYDVI